MKKSKENILCVFPEDQSLSFLSSLKDYLERYYILHLIQPNKASYDETISLIGSMKQESLILFFGHGASHCLYGACDDSFSQQKLIDGSNAHILKNKNIFSLSCRSNDFLDSHKAVLNNYFGFGDLPTDWDEIIAERNTGDPFYLNSINQSVINDFKIAVNNIILSAFKETEDPFDFRQLYLSLKLAINKKISILLTRNCTPNNRELANLLYSMKNDILVNL